MKGVAAGFQLLTIAIMNLIPEAAGILDPLLILTHRKLISYILYQFFSIKIIKSRRPHFSFCYFCLLCLLQVFHIYYIPEVVIWMYSAKKNSLKFLTISKFEILTKYLKNTFKVAGLIFFKKWKLLQGIFLRILLVVQKMHFVEHLKMAVGCFQKESSVCVSDFWKKNCFAEILDEI